MPVEKPQHRPPFDVYAPMLQIVDGCTHGKCKFCSIFHDIPFHMLPMETIIQDCHDIVEKFGPIEKRRIYLTGGNPYSLPNSKLLPILQTVKDIIPEVKEFGGFCRIADVKRRSDKELRELAAHGVNMITIGAEGGYDPALEFMVKGHNAQDVMEQGERLHAAGIKFCYFYLTGMAGAGKGQENAVASGKAFSAANPDYILVMTISPSKAWPLRDDIQSGAWVPPSEVEFAQEIRTFIANLDCNSYVNCSHDTDVIRFDAQMPQDKEKALMLMDDRIPKLRPDAARRMRNFIHNCAFED